MTELHLPDGYRFAGVHCGIRPDPKRLDLALVVSDRPATAVGVFTQNRVCAAPVHLCRERVPTDKARGVVICSGNANACTGAQGRKDAQRMAVVAAEAIGCKATQMLVCSTGVIGHPLPMKCIEPGIRKAAKGLSASDEAFNDSAHAILTTDTRIKVASEKLEQCVVTGFAKGAAMIGPNLATMLAFIITDASVRPNHLADIAQQAVNESFNCISVEGHTSTNDTVLFFANGNGPALKRNQQLELNALRNAVRGVCYHLARAIAADAEGASHLVLIQVTGLRTYEEAQQVAKTVANSPLVKTAIFGGDPNWGRIVSAAGYAGVNFEEKDLSCRLGPFWLYRRGVPKKFDAAAASAYLKENREITVWLDFRLGDCHGYFWTSDLTYEYVRQNAEYTT